MPGAGVLGELLAGCRGVRMLVTSREPLRLAGEQQYEVPVLDPEDAIELFIARATAVAPGLIIERETAAAVCERLDRLPSRSSSPPPEPRRSRRPRSLIGSSAACRPLPAVRATRRGASKRFRRRSTGATNCSPTGTAAVHPTRRVRWRLHA